MEYQGETSMLLMISMITAVLGALNLVDLIIEGGTCQGTADPARM